MQLGFNPQQYDFYTGIELLPAADYPGRHRRCCRRTRERAQQADLLKITFVVAQGHANAGRKLFYRLNLWNVSEESKATAHKQLKTLCYAVGITGMLNTEDELKGRQCIVEINNDGTYNNVKAVKDMAGNVPGKTPVTQGMPGQSGMPPFSVPQGAPAGFTPQGAMPPGYNPNQQQQPPAQQPPPATACLPAAAARPAGRQSISKPAERPPAGHADAVPAARRRVRRGTVDRRRAHRPNSSQQQYQQPPAQQPPQGQYQPQAQPPANPGMQFTPAQQQQQPPAGWPQQ